MGNWGALEDEGAGRKISPAPIILPVEIAFSYD